MRVNLFIHPLYVCCILTMIGLFLDLRGCSAANTCHMTTHQNPADGVCGSVTIRTLEQFDRLQNCTVVEGFVKIMLVKLKNEERFPKSLTFPLLREIDHFLMIYRIDGLKSLQQLFPNLAVIRGSELFYNYALVAYENKNLEELGLINLQVIKRGAVRLNKNKKLCYIDTIDWGRLAVDVLPSEHNFNENKDATQCVDHCLDGCPVTDYNKVNARRCWTGKHCQLNLACPDHCGNGSCMANGVCCHDYCIGGCEAIGPDKCMACKHVVYNGKCQPECDPGTYKFANRRCLTDQECLNLRNRSDNVDGKRPLLLPPAMKGDDGLCVMSCPSGYTVAKEGKLKDLACVKCQGFCPKECNGTDVNSIQKAQQLHGCSKIIGHLIIQIVDSSSAVDVLEEHLGNIREVTSSITIRKSYALLNLNFFKRLEIIGGEQLNNLGQSLVVMDNANLQELFPEDIMKNLVIKNGKVSFHYNRQLCVYKINEFVNYLNLTEAPTEADISSSNNGDLLPCMKQELQLEVTNIYHNAAVLVWDKDRGDERNLLTYMINYKEIEDKNVNIHQGRDACSDEVWTVKEHSPSETTVEHEIGMVSHLKPYTMYAVYVQAYTLSTATHSALTHVQTFITDPYYPSEPRDLEVTSENPQELTVTWKPPKYPNGNVTHYVLNYFKQVIDPKSYERRNYCKEPIQTPKVDNTEKVSKNEEMKNISDTCCACPKSKKELEQEARKQEIEVYFENFLQNNVYCKRYDKLPPEISVDFVTIEQLANKFHDLKSQETGQQPTASDNDWFEHDFNMTKIPTDRSTESENHGDTHVDTIEIHKGSSATLSNLEPFTEYIIEIQACQNTNTSPSVDTKLCSNREIISGRTKAKWELDKINETSITYETIKTNASIDVLIKWDPPERPNGLILMYYISYKRVWNGQQNIVPQQICISQVEYGKYNGTRIKGLEVGNWTYWINAVSLAGNSSQTKEHFFLIPSPPGGNDTSYVFIIIVIIVVIVILVICIAVACLYAKYKFRREDMTVISTNANYVPSEHMYIMDSWEVDRDKIKLVRELGQGSFGMVYEGSALGLGEDPDDEIRVAVKTVNDRASFNDKREFLKEATTMKAFDCYHVVKLLGVVSHGQPALVIMELMALGDLKNYLREHRPDEHERPGVSPPRLLDILQMAGEIADGMAYLAAKKFVHRDLAARNCMVDEDKTVKIGDFGMTRDIYETDYYRKGGKGMLPVRWMAPESLRDGVFTTMSDVWSYGVVMWEMVTLAAQPYQGLSNEEVVKFISSGNTMDMPDNCPEEMAHLMQRCWARKPKCRPTFMDIIEYLLPNLNSRFDKVSYFFNEGGGPVEGGRGGNLEPPADEDDEEDDQGAEGGEEEDFSDNGSSLEGAAALPLNSSRDRDFPLDCVQVTHPSYGRDHNGVLGTTGERDSFYQFNEMPGNAGHDSNHLKGSLEGENFINDCGRSDSSRSFIGGDNHFVPHTTTPHSALPGPSHRNGDGLTGLNDAGVIELQPLIGDDKLPPAENLFSLPSPNSDQSKVGSSASRYPGYQRLPLGASSHPSSSPTNSLPPSTSSSHGRMDRPSAPHHRQGASRPSQSLGASSSSSQSSSPSSPPPLLSAACTAAPQALPPSRPSLRLPVLNQPPGGGFRQVPLFNSGTRDNSKNFPYRNSGGYPSYQPTSALSSTGNSHNNKLPAMGTQLGQGDQQSEGINDSPLIAHSSDTSPQASVTGNGSSDARKDSTNNSDNYSQMNGLTNGFVNWHRTAPC